MKTKERDELLRVLKGRFDNNTHRHPHLSWAEIESRIEARADVLRSLHLMETTGGEPDVVVLGAEDGLLSFCDCSKESPIGRRIELTSATSSTPPTPTAASSTTNLTLGDGARPD